MRIVNKDRICVGDVQSRFHNGGGNQYIVFSFDEAEHDVFQLFPFHLSVPHCNTDSGTESPDEAGHFFNITDAIMDKENLTPALCLKFNGFTDQCFVEYMQLNHYRDRKSTLLNSL